MKKFIMAALAAAVISTASYAVHSWGGYHWERSSNPLNLTIINSTTGAWDDYVALAVGDWYLSSVLNLTEDISGSTSTRTRRRCKPPGGKVRICNLAYGNNGWLGLAGISINSEGHIVSGYTKLNDTYYATGSYYDTPAWRQSVTCQELGHNVGLTHQDVDFVIASSTSCMEYQSPPFVSPDPHDYEQLELIYAHLDESDDGGGGGGGCNAPPGKGCNKNGTNGHNGDVAWGMSLGRRGQSETFMRIHPDGSRHLTHVTWAEGF